MFLLLYIPVFPDNGRASTFDEIVDFGITVFIAVPGDREHRGCLRDITR